MASRPRFSIRFSPTDFAGRLLLLSYLQAAAGEDCDAGSTVPPGMLVPVAASELTLLMPCVSALHKVINQLIQVQVLRAALSGSKPSCQGAPFPHQRGAVQPLHEPMGRLDRTRSWTGVCRLGLGHSAVFILAAPEDRELKNAVTCSTQLLESSRRMQRCRGFGFLGLRSSCFWHGTASSWATSRTSWRTRQCR